MDVLLCSYRNCSERMRIIRCCGPDDFFLERVVFPFEVLTFHCPPASDVEVWAKDSLGVVLTEQLSADAMAIVRIILLLLLIRLQNTQASL